jgi:hypothetical protein
MRQLDNTDLIRKYRDAEGYNAVMLSAMWDKPPRPAWLTCAGVERVVWWGVAACAVGLIIWVGGRQLVALLVGG